MALKMKKSGLVIAVSIVALIAAAVLAGCPDLGFDIATPETDLDNGPLTGGGDNTRIEIYFDYDVIADRDGQKLVFPYNQSNPTETTHLIAAKVFNAPDAEYLQWAIQYQTALGSFVRFNPAEVLGTPVPNGYSFTAYAGLKPNFFEGGGAYNTVILHVWNTDAEGRRGKAHAQIELVVGGLTTIPDLFVSETRTVSGVGFVKADNGSPPSLPVWSVRPDMYVVSGPGGLAIPGGNAEISRVSHGGFDGGGYTVTSLDITGLQAGTATYLTTTKQGGVNVNTEGTLIVLASTIWYVGKGAGGTYGFRPADKVTLNRALERIQAYYTGSRWLWPRKGEGAGEQPAVLKFTSDEAGVILGFGGTNFPMNIDLENDSPTGQKTLTSSGINTGPGRTVTLSGIKVIGSVRVDNKARVVMKTPYTELTGNRIDVLSGGVFTMNDGVISIIDTAVKNGGTLTVDKGRIDSKVNVEAGGELTLKAGSTLQGTVTAKGNVVVEGGTFRSAQTTVQSGGVFTMTNGTLGALLSGPGEIPVYTAMKVQSGGTLTVNKGSVNGNIYVEVGGTLTLKAGTVIGPGAKIFKHGTPAVLSSPLTADYNIVP